jgi:hypothetical protein
VKDFSQYVHTDLPSARAKCSGRDRVYRVELHGETSFVVAHSPERAIACAARTAGATASLAEPERLSELGEKRVAAVFAALQSLDEKTRQALMNVLLPVEAAKRD